MFFVIPPKLKPFSFLTFHRELSRELGIFKTSNTSEKKWYLGPRSGFLLGKMADVQGSQLAVCFREVASKMGKIHPRSLTARPMKMLLGTQAFPFGYIFRAELLQLPGSDGFSAKFFGYFRGHKPPITPDDPCRHHKTGLQGFTTSFFAQNLRMVPKGKRNVQD